MEIEYFMVFGYFFISMAVGIFSVAAIVDLWKMRKEGTSGHASVKTVRTANIISLPLVLVGAVCTLLHLGRPTHFFYIISEWSSWLTREAWSMGLFILFSFISFLIWLRKPAADSGKARKIVEITGTVFGIITVISMSMVYISVKAIAAWNTMLIMYMNLANAFALGVSLYGLILAVNYLKTNNTNLLERLQSICCVSLVAILCVGVTTLSYQLQLSFLEGSMNGTGLVLAKIIVGILLPLLLIFYAWANRKKKSSILTYSLITFFVLLVAGDIIGRMLHFLVAGKSMFPPIL